MKRCSSCKETKPVTDFRKNRSTNDGLGAYCKPCAKVKNKESDDRHRESINERERARHHQRKSDPAYIQKRKEQYAAYQESGRARDKVLRRVYGISLDQYNAIFEAQDYRCAICRCTEEEAEAKSSQGFCVDHDHETGAVRNILCSHCNRGIGLLQDDSTVLEAAANYLRGHGR